MSRSQWSKSPRMDEVFVDRLQNHFEQLVPLGLGGGNSQWSQFAVCFRDVDSFDRLRYSPVSSSSRSCSTRRSRPLWRPSTCCLVMPLRPGVWLPWQTPRLSQRNHPASQTSRYNRLCRCAGFSSVHRASSCWIFRLCRIHCLRVIGLAPSPCKRCYRLYSGA